MTMGAECLSETPFLTYKQIGLHSPRQKSQNTTYQPTSQDSNFNMNLNFIKTIRYVNATHSIFKSAPPKKLRSLTVNISSSWQETLRLSQFCGCLIKKSVPFIASPGTTIIERLHRSQNSMPRQTIKAFLHKHHVRFFIHATVYHNRFPFK